MHYLIVKTSAFGDIVQSYAVLEYLKERDPNCQIDWVVERRMADIVSNHPLVDRTILIDTHAWRKNLKNSLSDMKSAISNIRETRYDALFDLQSNVKSSLITLFAHAKDKVGFGFKTAHESMSSLVLSKKYNPPKGLNIREEYLYIVQSYFSDFTAVQPKTLLKVEKTLSIPSANWMVCPGSNWKNKQLTLETLTSFLEKCKVQYRPTYLFLCGSDDEKRVATLLMEKFPGSELLFRPNLAELQNIMASMQIVISMDSLPLHFAATANVPTFSFFGPSSARKYAPHGALHGTFQGSCPYGETFEKRCTKLRTCPTGACLRSADSERLFQQFAGWYKL